MVTTGENCCYGFGVRVCLWVRAASQLLFGSPVEDEAPARAHFGGRHVDSEASIGRRDNEKQLH